MLLLTHTQREWETGFQCITGPLYSICLSAHVLCNAGSLCSSFLTQCYQLPVLDSIFLRKQHRGKGHGVQILEDFVNCFTEDTLGLRYPLSPAMYKVCAQYLDKYPGDQDLLWEVEGIGGLFQRVRLSSRIQALALKGKIASHFITCVGLRDSANTPVSTRTRSSHYRRKRLREEEEEEAKISAPQPTPPDRTISSEPMEAAAETPVEEEPDEEAEEPQTHQPEAEPEEEAKGEEEEQEELESELLKKPDVEPVNGEVTDEMTQTSLGAEEAVDKEHSDTPSIAQSDSVEQEAGVTEAADEPAQNDTRDEGEVDEVDVESPEETHEQEAASPEGDTENGGPAGDEEAAPESLDDTTAEPYPNGPEPGYEAASPEGDTENGGPAGDEEAAPESLDDTTAEPCEETVHDRAVNSEQPEETTGEATETARTAETEVAEEKPEESCNDNEAEQDLQTPMDLSQDTLLLVELKDVSFQPQMEEQKDQVKEPDEEPEEQPEQDSTPAAKEKAVESNSDEAESEPPVVDRRVLRRKAKASRGPTKKHSKTST
ncbi:UNVERIFIED_CONTAM: hypothetical protein FKN15_044742 [Acipenser sinensis]